MVEDKNILGSKTKCRLVTETEVTTLIINRGASVNKQRRYRGCGN